jgi:hypothetical protein
MKDQNSVMLYQSKSSKKEIILLKKVILETLSTLLVKEKQLQLSRFKLAKNPRLWWLTKEVTILEKERY